MIHLQVQVKIGLLREQIREIVTSTYHIRREICSNLGNAPSEADEKGSATTGGAFPLSSERKWIPDVFAIDNLGRGCTNDTK